MIVAINISNLWATKQITGVNVFPQNQDRSGMNRVSNRISLGSEALDHVAPLEASSAKAFKPKVTPIGAKKRVIIT